MEGGDWDMCQSAVAQSSSSGRNYAAAVKKAPGTKTHAPQEITHAHKSGTPEGPEDTEHAQNDLAPGDAEVNVELLQDALAEVQLQKSAQETAAETKPEESGVENSQQAEDTVIQEDSTNQNQGSETSNENEEQTSRQESAGKPANQSSGIVTAQKKKKPAREVFPKDPSCLYHGQKTRGDFQRLLNLLRASDDDVMRIYIPRMGTATCVCKPKELTTSGDDNSKDCSDEKFDQLKLNDLIAQLRTRFPEVTPKIDGVSRLLLDADAANQSMNKLYVILRDICNRKYSRLQPKKEDSTADSKLKTTLTLSLDHKYVPLFVEWGKCRGYLSKLDEWHRQMCEGGEPGSVKLKISAESQTYLALASDALQKHAEEITAKRKQHEERVRQFAKRRCAIRHVLREAKDDKITDTRAIEPDIDEGSRTAAHGVVSGPGAPGVQDLHVPIGYSAAHVHGWCGGKVTGISIGSRSAPASGRGGTVVTGISIGRRPARARGKERRIAWPTGFSAGEPSGVPTGSRVAPASGRGGGVVTGISIGYRSGRRLGRIGGRPGTLPQ